jgi:hypothetical protein
LNRIAILSLIVLSALVLAALYLLAWSESEDEFLPIDRDLTLLDPTTGHHLPERHAPASSKKNTKAVSPKSEKPGLGGDSRVYGKVILEDDAIAAHVTVVLFSDGPETQVGLDFDIEIGAGSFIPDPYFYDSVDLAVALYQGRFKVEDHVKPESSQNLVGWIEDTQAMGFDHVRVTQANAQGEFEFRDLPQLDDQENWVVKAGESGFGVSVSQFFAVGTEGTVIIEKVPAMVVVRFTTPEPDLADTTIYMNDGPNMAALNPQMTQLSGTTRRDLFIASHAPSMVEGWIDATFSARQPLASIRLEQGSVHVLDLGLRDAGSIEGRVLDPKGKPVPFARVEAKFSPGNAVDGVEALAFADFSGRFRLLGLPLGKNIRLTWRRFGYAKVGPKNFEGGATNVTLELSPQAILRGIVIGGQKGENVAEPELSVSSELGRLWIVASQIPTTAFGWRKEVPMDENRCRLAVRGLESMGLIVNPPNVLQWLEVFSSSISEDGNGFEIQGVEGSGKTLHVRDPSGRYHPKIIQLPELLPGEIREGFIIRLDKK